MKIDILESGGVAKTLAGGFLKHGHEVMLGTHEPARSCTVIAVGNPVFVRGVWPAARSGAYQCR